MFVLSQIFWLLLLPLPPQVEATVITAAQAKQRIGERVKVCGVIATIYESQRNKRNPTMLNFNQPYPKNDFTALIWREDRAQFGNVRALEGKRACVTGEVYAYRGRAQMKLQTSQQIERRDMQNLGWGFLGVASAPRAS